MPHQRCLGLILAGIAWFYALAPAHAQHSEPQPSPRSYVQIPFEGDLDRALADQLLNARHLKIINNVLEKIRPADIAKLDLNNHRELAAIVKKEAKDLPEPELKKAVEAFKKVVIKDAAGAGGKEKHSRPPAHSSRAQPRPVRAPAPDRGQPPVQTAPEEEALARWTRDLLKEADRWEWDDTLKNSPALNEGLKDLEHLLPSGEVVRNGMPAEDLARWAARFRPETSQAFKMPDLGWLKPQALSVPSLPGLNLRVPRLGSWGGGVRLPRLGGSGLNGRAFGHGFLWIAVLGLAALVAWQLMRQWSGMRARPAGAPWKLGPWPVNPADVATRADVIRAFEYLSLLRLGPDARSWNHRAIAANLGEKQDDQRRGAADELASLYERARYAPAEDLFPPEALACARRDLCLLAGVASV